MGNKEKSIRIHRYDARVVPDSASGGMIATSNVDQSSKFVYVVDFGQPAWAPPWSEYLDTLAVWSFSLIMEHDLDIDVLCLSSTAARMLLPWMFTSRSSIAGPLWPL
jgi:hypothetical protein